MEANLKAKWVAALRSGEYKQARNLLKTDDGFCCLGVLCDVLDNSKWIKDADDFYIYQFGGGENNGTDLASSVKKQHGLNQPTFDHRLYGETFSNHLMSMNDEYHNSFEEIADYIEENL